MIEKIILDNFKSHVHTEIELGRVTALVGPNGCGKTSILQAIHLISLIPSALEQDWRSVLNGSSSPDLIVKNGQTEFTIALTGTHLSHPWNVAIGFLKYPHRGWAMYVLKPDSVKVSEGEEIRGSRQVRNSLDSVAVENLRQVTFFKPVPDYLSQASYSDNTTPSMGVDGSNLASTITSIIGKSPDLHQQIVAQLKKLVPQIQAVGFRPAKVIRKETRVLTLEGKQFPLPEDRELIGQELLFDIIGAHGLPAGAMSTGTLLALGVLTRFYNCPDDSTILFDDIEQGLHALAQRRLIKILKEFTERNNKQILLTTHSGYIVDELEPENVWVMHTDEQGISRCKRLSEHPDTARLLQVLTTGELADAVGEDWVLPQAPQVIVAGEANA